jgi:hypothetical protein
MSAKPRDHRSEKTGVDDVRRVREQIAGQHKGDLEAHIAQTNRIAQKLGRKLRLGPVVPPPARGGQRSGTEAQTAPRAYRTSTGVPFFLADSYMAWMIATALRASGPQVSASRSLAQAS